MKTKFYIMTVCLAAFSLFSCQKDSSQVEQAGLNAAEDDVASDAVYDDVYNTADNATIILDALAKGGEAKGVVVVSDSCPTVTISTIEPGVWPKTVTIDFGEGCTGLWDNTRSGKIIIEVTGPRLEEGSKRTITFENYYFNGIKVEGTKVVENMGYNDNQNMVFSVTLTGGKLTLPGGKTVERSYTHQREWIGGLLTRNIWDDECLVTGTASGVTIEGIVYNNTITTALYWKRVCNFIVSGVVKIERADRPAIEVNYGEGECDNKAVVTVNGESKEIQLRHRLRTM